MTVTGDRPDLPSYSGPHRDNTATFRQKIISVEKFQSEFDTNTDWLDIVGPLTETHKGNKYILSRTNSANF
jgi:hypothetical protein